MAASGPNKGVHIVDPFAEDDGRLRLAIVDGVLRLPTSNPAISDELELITPAILAQTLYQQTMHNTTVLEAILVELKIMNQHLAEITDEEFLNDPNI